MLPTDIFRYGLYYYEMIHNIHILIGRQHRMRTTSAAIGTGANHTAINSNTEVQWSHLCHYNYAQVNDGCVRFRSRYITEKITDDETLTENLDWAFSSTVVGRCTLPVAQVRPA